MYLRRSNHETRKKGNAIVISIISVAVMSVAIIGVGTLIIHSTDKNKLAQEAKASYFIVDGMFEASMYDISGHGPGYQVSDNLSNYNRRRFGNDGHVRWTLEDRAVVIEDGATEYDASEYNMGPGCCIDYMAVPSPGKGDSPSNTNWNRIEPGGNDTLELYVDNTSCTQSGANCAS